MTDITAVRQDSHTGSLILAWAILVGLTLMSWWFSDHGLGPAAAITAILVLTFIKVFMVGHSFMELSRAPTLLRSAFAAWCAGLCAVLIVLAFAF